MKSMTAALAAHLKGDLTRCAELVRISRTDGVTIGLTTHDADIDFGGVLYRADGSYEGGRMRQSANLRAEDYNVTGVIGSASITEADLKAGYYDFARIDVYLCNWSDLTQGAVHLRRGWIGEVRYSEGGYRAALRGFQDLLDRKVCETYTPECRFDLGSARCGVNLAAFTVSGSVTSVYDDMSFADYTRSEPDGAFQDARLTWTTGANAGASVEVRSWDGDEKIFGLWSIMEHPVAVGDSYSVTWGCDKRFATCKARFGNVARFGGFPHLPGLSQILLYPDVRS